MYGAVPRAVPLAVCFAAFAAFAALLFPACSSEEAHRADRGEAGERGAPTAGGASLPGEAVGRVVVEGAVLSSAGERRLIHVRVRYEGPGMWPRCSLVEGPDVEAVRETIERRDPPRAEGWTSELWQESLWADHESLWADRRSAEASLADGGEVVWLLREDGNRDGEAADPTRTPFFVRCAGGSGPTVVRDMAHVAGTPETPRKPGRRAQDARPVNEARETAARRPPSVARS